LENSILLKSFKKSEKINKFIRERGVARKGVKGGPDPPFEIEIFIFLNPF